MTFPNNDHEPLPSNHRTTHVDDLVIVTDRLDYAGHDQVLPLFDEQQFFLDELPRASLVGTHALEVGLGSGVLSIAIARSGAEQVTGLEINPRARRFASFNIARNQVASTVHIVAGDAQIFLPVKGRRFDFIFSNPPFMPAPLGVTCHLHSDAGPLGLHFIDALLAELPDHVTADGRAQIVTAAPGDADGPTLLVDLLKRRLSGTTTVVVSPGAVPFTDCLARLRGQPEAAAQMDALRHDAAQAGATHMHLCVVHFHKAPGPLEVRPARKAYDLNRLLPSTEGETDSLPP